MDSKACAACREVKTLDNFAPHKSGTLGRYSYCRSCVRLRNIAYYSANKEREKARVRLDKLKNAGRVKSSMSKWHRDNVDREREYFRRNADNLKAKAAEWKRANKDRVYASGKARRIRKRKAMPTWANIEKMTEFYRKARILTEETGIPHEVDHIYPLQSKWICGLHCANNLRVITRSENRSKSNKFNPDQTSILKAA